MLPKKAQEKEKMAVRFVFAAWEIVIYNGTNNFGITMKRIVLSTLILSLCIGFIPAARADLRMGASATTADLAAHLGILVWSFNYTAPKPYRKLEVRFNYYEKNASGGFEARPLSGFILTPVKIETKTTFKFFVDATKSTIVQPETSVTGAGFAVSKDDATLYTPQPVEPSKDGRYIIWQSAPAGARLTHGVLAENAKSYLELEIKPTF